MGSEGRRDELTASEVARQANAHIHEMAASLDSFVRDVRPLGFFCECGCMGIVAAAPTEVEAGGAWLDGHEPHSVTDAA
jgi:hypothetical protein